jgi:glycosyltransferase involved in cell wall biosynthesis
LNLLTVSHFFESHRGGIEIVAGRLARELARAGMSVVWAATDASPPPDVAHEPRLSTIALSASNVAERAIGIPYPVPGPRSLLRLWREAQAADAVLVHDGLYLTSIAACLAARRKGRPVVVVQHIGAVPYKNPLLRSLMALANRLIARPMLARADKTVFISESTARYFAGLPYRQPPELVFNGVDTAIFSPPQDADEVAETRRHCGLPQDRVVALFAGRFVEKKGLAVLERVARARPDMVFAFAGWGPLDPRAWKLANVQVFDQLAGASLAKLYRASDALVLPSTGEGFPLVVQEALACGLPVVCGAETTTADPAAAQLLTGIEIDTADPDRTAQLCAAALTACVQRQSSAALRSARATLAAERYSWSRAAARYVEILKRLHVQRSRLPDSEAAPERLRSLHEGG